MALAKRLINKTQGGAELARHVLKAGGAWGRIKGLIGQNELPAGSCLWIPASPGIHTFFMKFPLSLVWTDKNFHVTDIRPSVKRGKMVWGALGSWHVFEFQEGGVSLEQVRKGDVLEAAG